MEQSKSKCPIRPSGNHRWAFRIPADDAARKCACGALARIDNSGHTIAVRS